MIRNSFQILAVLVLALAVSVQANAQTSTKNLTINGGTGLTGSLSGNLNAQIKSQSSGGVQTAGALFITDLDLALNGSGVVPNGGVNNATASAPLVIPNSSVNISIPQTNFNSPLSGSVSITAGDNLANGVVGALDSGVAGSDGAWDDPGNTGILNNAVVNSVTLTANSPINAPVNVTGGFNFGIGNDLLIPDVIDNFFVNASFRLKQSSTFGISLDNAQNISLQNLSFSTSVPIALNTPESNFVEAAHPTGVPQLDLSTGGVGFVETFVSGNLVADLTGSIVGNVDLAADITVLGLIPFTINFNDALNGNLAGPGITLLDLSQAIALPGVPLPFLFSVLHDPTTDVDFDDVIAEIQAGSFGFPIPFSVSEELILPLQGLDFAIQNQQFSFDVPSPIGGFNIGGGDATVDIAASLGGNIVFDLSADLTLGLDMVASAFQAGAINVTSVPEPTSGLFLASLGLASGLLARRKRV